MAKRKLINQHKTTKPTGLFSNHKARLKIGTLIGFSFAGQNLMGKIKAIKVDSG